MTMAIQVSISVYIISIFWHDLAYQTELVTQVASGFFYQVTRGMRDGGQSFRGIIVVKQARNVKIHNYLTSERNFQIYSPQ